MLDKFRPIISYYLKPIIKKLDINPNIITIISPFIAIIAAYFFANKNLLIGALFILLSGFLDVMDGAIARYHNKTSKFGGFLDSTMDRFADAIIYIGIIFGGYADWFIGILAIHSAITISYVRARAESEDIKCNVGIAERAVRLLILVLGSFIAGITNIIGFPNSDIILIVTIYILIILSYFTVGQRIHHVYNELKKKVNNI